MILFLICFCIILIACAIQDIKTAQIPPILPLLVAGCFWLNPMWNKKDSFIGFIVCGGILLLACCFRFDSFGGGDIKLCAAVGFTLGAMPSILGLLFALLFSIPVAIIKQYKKQSHMIFAPYLAAGFSLAAFLNYLNYGGFIQ